MCGRQEATLSALVEGVELNVCQNCSRYGQILRKPVFAEAPKKKVVIDGPEIIIVENYAKLIKEKREDLGLSQEDFAKILNEKLSTFQNIESGHLKPDIKFAEKMKRMFGLILTKEIKKEPIKLDKPKTESFTLGDFIKKN
jgi:putative transcription factor